jgi:hypothetical protein
MKGSFPDSSPSSVRLCEGNYADGKISFEKGNLKTLKSTTLTTLSIASLALLFSACSSTSNTTTNSSTANTVNKNTAVVVNSSPTTANKTAPVSTTPTPAGEAEASEIQGELQVGKTESVILYVGMETGDYAAYCFTNDSEAGRAILAACKDREQCAVTGTIDDYRCKVPGLEADLSASAKISKVQSVKSLGRKK